MPTQIDLQHRPVTLSPEFVYEHTGGDDVVVAAFQGPEKMNEEQTLKEGDVVDSANALTAYTLGAAVLTQYSHEESVPDRTVPKKSSKKK